MFLAENERKKVNSVTRYDKTLKEIEREEDYLVRYFDENIESILGKFLVNYLVENNYIKVKNVNGKIVGDNVLRTFHFSDLPHDASFRRKDGSLISVRDFYLSRLRPFFNERTEEYKKRMTGDLSGRMIDDNLVKTFALASLGLTSFHRRKNMVLRDVQKIAALGMAYGQVAELGTGEGKTLAAVLPCYMHALRGKGVHVVTANNYLSSRDFEELKPIYEGLGLTCGYVKSSEEEKDYDELKRSKKRAYAADITFSAKDEIAFDYLRDSTAQSIDDVVTRDGRSGFAVIDEIDDALVDSASSPYIIAGTPPYYQENMTLKDLATSLSIPLSKMISQLKLRGMNTDLNRPYTYREAIDVAELFSKILYQDEHFNLRIAQVFYDNLRLVPVTIDPRDQKIFDARKDVVSMENGILRVYDKRLFELLQSGDASKDNSAYYGKYKYTPDEVAALLKYAKVVICPTSNDFFITSDVIENHTNLQFLSSKRTMDLVNKYKNEIINNFERGKDYTINNKTGEVNFTMEGFKKLGSEKFKNLLPELYKEYETLITNRSEYGAYYSYILRECIIANELQKKGEDYIVRDGKIVLLRNAREREGSSYSNGLHQAIEVKEALNDAVKLTHENPSLASITQKDFYRRYELFSGMTGTSATKIFEERYSKNTLEIPRDSFYKFYSPRLRRERRSTTKEPRGVEKKDAVFAQNRNDKFNLIYNSIVKSRSTNPMQPILIVVSDPEEIPLLEKYLQGRGVSPSIVETSRLKGDKRKSEANLIANAGRAGSVTIATEMAGRGTDIKIGGDREVIIDIATDNMMKKCNLSDDKRNSTRLVVEEELQRRGIILSKEAEEREREALSDIGLKVISSGFFDSSRIDRQLEGRTGRNGYSGVTERFSSIEDLVHLGLERVSGEPVKTLLDRCKKKEDGSLDMSKKDYERLMHSIEIFQSENDEKVNRTLKFSQDLTEFTTKVMDQIRDERRHLLEITSSDEKLLENEMTIRSKVFEMIEETVDNILVSYTENKKFSYYESGDSKDKLTINYEGLRLACSEILGIDVDIDAIKNSDISILEFRNALIEYAKSRHDKGLEQNKLEGLKQDVAALLAKSDCSLSRIHEREEQVRSQKSFNAMTLEGNIDAIATISLNQMLSGLEYESSKAGVRILMGRVLPEKEKDRLETIREELFDLREKDGEIMEPASKENDYAAIHEFREKLKSTFARAEKERLVADKKASKMYRKNPDSDVSKVYKNLRIRPMSFIRNLDGTMVLQRTTPTYENLLGSGKTI